MDNYFKTMKDHCGDKGIKLKDGYPNIIVILFNREENSGFSCLNWNMVVQHVS